MINSAKIYRFFSFNKMENNKKKHSTNRFNHVHLRIVSSASKVLLIKKGRFITLVTQSRARELIRRRIGKIDFSQASGTTHAHSRVDWHNPPLREGIGRRPSGTCPGWSRGSRIFPSIFFVVSSCLRLRFAFAFSLPAAV